MGLEMPPLRSLITGIAVCGLSLGGLSLCSLSLCSLSEQAFATEGNSVAGPIGGTDMRSAMLPPPGLWGGTIYVYAAAYGFTDGNGNDVPALDGLDLASNLTGGFLVYVPPVQIFGGTVGFAGVLPGGESGGRLFTGAPKHRIFGLGDAYVEADWSRFFGSIRPSQYPGAFPIAEGLVVELGAGMIIPTGKYDAQQARTEGLLIGNNTWAFAPLVAFTYTTPPILAEGTEFSAKIYWNNYLTNSQTNYKAGSLIDIDFAITEHIGRFQVGLAGVYFSQIEDDTLNGVAILPDGRRATLFSVGGIAAYDMPEMGASMKIKALGNVLQENFVHSYGLAFTFVKKLD
jgi:hypothetical protein